MFLRGDEIIVATAVATAQQDRCHTKSVFQELCEGGELEKTLGKSHYSERTVRALWQDLTAPSLRRFVYSSKCGIHVARMHTLGGF